LIKKLDLTSASLKYYESSYNIDIHINKKI